MQVGSEIQSRLDKITKLPRGVRIALSATAAIAVGLAYLAVTRVEAPLLRLLLASTVAVPIYILSSWLFNREWVLAMRQLALVR